MTTTKATKQAFAPQARLRAAKELEGVRVISERHSDDLVITTLLPKHQLLARPFLGSNFTIEYVIKVPRKARLFIDHDREHHIGSSNSASAAISSSRPGITGGR